MRRLFAARRDAGEDDVSEPAMWAVAEQARAVEEQARVGLDRWEDEEKALYGPDPEMWDEMFEREHTRMRGEILAHQWGDRSSLYVGLALQEEVPDLTLLEGLPEPLPPSPRPRPWQIAGAR